MTRCTNWLSDQYQGCKGLLDRAVDAVGDRQWLAARDWHFELAEALDRHTRVEEDLLFPRFEPAGDFDGPTQAIRGEHAQMRKVLTAMAQALWDRDSQGYGRAAGVLKSMMARHMAKEEAELYPIIDQRLGEEADAIVDQFCEEQA